MSAHAAAPTRRLAASLAVAAAALGLAACGGGSPTGPAAPAESNDATIRPERETVCKLPDDTLFPRIAPGFCPLRGVGRQVE